MKVAIHFNDKEGFVKYNKGNQEVMVTHPDELVRQGVRKYLNTERPFDVAASSDPNKRGHKLQIRMKPNENEWGMQMALTEMYHHIGVKVNWGHKDNVLENISSDPNAQADKPILKSIFNDCGFDIIN